jgi:hypothetical protein
MPWFPVDDRFHSHPKAAAASLAALGLWTVAGSWAREHLRDGDVPGHMIPSLSRGATELADELVTVGLWRRTKAGYRFHQWNADGDGSPRNSTRSEVQAQRDRKSSGGVLGNHRRWHTSRGVRDPACAYCQPEHPPPNHRTTDRTTDRGSDRSPNPPIPDLSPTKEGGRPREVTPVARDPTTPPPETCQRHPNGTNDPCGPCKTARLNHERWQTDQATARTDRQRSGPRCPTHPTEPADHCRPCRSERLARTEPT